jgi:hypothetical protein
VGGCEEHHCLFWFSSLERVPGRRSDNNFLKTCENGQGLGLTGTIAFRFALEFNV